MLTDYLAGNVMFETSIPTWEAAITKAAQPLLDSHSITPEYIKGMIDNVNENGSYMVILPEVAIPHARKEFGALKTGITFLQVKEPVMFPDNKPVKLLLAISSETNDGHLSLLGELGMALMDETIVSRLKEAKTEKEVLALIKSVED